MNQIKFERLNNKPSRSYGYEIPREYNVGFVPHKSGIYRIEIDSAIEDVSQFSTAIQILGLAKEDDEVEVHLQSPGGNIDASGAFLHALRKCRAPIHMIASGGCHSAATHILLEADSFELADNFNSLVHNGQSGSVGNINEYHAKSDFDKKFLFEHYQSIYEGFLTDEEFKGVMRGDQIWLDAKGWYDRSILRQAHFQAKVDKLSKKPRKAHKKPVDKPTEE